MAVTLIGQKKVGGASIKKSSKRLVYEETYEFLVRTDDPLTTRAAVLSSSAVPKVNQTVGTGGFTICNSVDAERNEENATLWRVSATFSSDIQEDNSGANESQSGDPTVWKPIAELAFETFTEVAFTDANGDPFDNSVGIPFASGIPLVRTLVRYDFVQFEPATTSIDTIADRNEKVNTATFNGRAAKTLKLQVKGAALGYYYGYRVWRVSYSMVYKPDTWVFKVLDVGNSVKSGTDILPYLDDAEPPNRIFGPLDGSGAKAAVASVLEFDKYEDISFSFLRV
jgi:hypothetical protein